MGRSTDDFAVLVIGVKMADYTSLVKLMSWRDNVVPFGSAVSNTCTSARSKFSTSQLTGHFIDLDVAVH